MHAFFMVVFSICLERISSHTFSHFEKLPLEIIEKYSKPPIAKEFFSKFTLGSKRWSLIEENNYTLDSCLPEGITQSNVADPIFKWYGPNSETLEVDESRMRAYDNGQLEIRLPHKEDSGSYFCEIISRTEPDMRVAFERIYAVFLYPQVILARRYYMQSKSCNYNSNIRFLELGLRIFCKGDPNCPYSFVPDTCLPYTDDSFETRFSIYQKLPSHYFNDLAEKCGIICKRNKSTNLLYQSSKSRAEEFDQNLVLLYGSETNELFYLNEKTQSFIMFICPDGYSNYNEYVCVPCDKGYHRRANNDSSQCEICNVLSYQDNIGQVECIKCGLFKLTAIYGARRATECIFFYQSWTAMLIIVPFLLVAIFVIVVMWMLIRMSGICMISKAIRNLIKKSSPKDFRKESGINKYYLKNRLYSAQIDAMRNEELTKLLKSHERAAQIGNNILMDHHKIHESKNENFTNDTKLLYPYDAAYNHGFSDN